MNKKEERALMNKLNSFLLWVLVGSLFLIITPFEVFNSDLASYIVKFKFVFWLTLIISSSNFISQGIIAICSYLYNRYDSKFKMKKITKMVSCLDFSERAVLREFVLQRKSVINLPLAEPTVKNLLNAGILSIAEDVVDLQGKTPLVINLDARPFITYKAVGLSRGKMSEEQIEQIMKARPKYAR